MIRQEYRRGAAVSVVADQLAAARGPGGVGPRDVETAEQLVDALDELLGLGLAGAALLAEPAPAAGAACAASPTGQHERGRGRDRDECRHCDERLSVPVTGEAGGSGVER